MRPHKGKISILVVPEEDGEPRSFRLSWRLLKGIIWTFAVFVLLLVAGVIASALVLKRAVDYNKVVQENRKLQDANRRVEQLSQDLERLEAMNEQIRSALGANIGVDTNFTKIRSDISLSDFAPEGSLFQASSPSFSMPLEGYITRGFSVGIYPRQGHSGVDIAVPEGTAVKAASDGWVAFIGWHQRYGNLIVLQHTGDFLTLYGHNRSLLADMGDRVEAGQIIAISGNSGQSSAPHLHFEIRRRGTTVDPAQFIPNYK